VYTSVFDSIRFVEGHPSGATIIGPVSIQIGGLIRSSQLRSLDDVKRLMAERAHAAGGNAVVDFRYGQRSVGFFASLFQRDDVNWYGTGQVARLP
jgi:hypothetical protein